MSHRKLKPNWNHQHQSREITVLSTSCADKVTRYSAQLSAKSKSSKTAAARAGFSFEGLLIKASVLLTAAVSERLRSRSRMKATHILQGDDVGMLSVSQQDLHLLRRVFLGLADDL